MCRLISGFARGQNTPLTPEGAIHSARAFLAEKTYCAQQFARYIGNASGGRVSLCPDDAMVELEMLSEKKELYGARSPLPRYAEMFGCAFHLVTFHNYTPPGTHES